MPHNKWDDLLGLGYNKEKQTNGLICLVFNYKAPQVKNGDEAQVATEEEEFLACHFLHAFNWEHHGGLVAHLENQFTLRIDLYPKNIMAAYNLATKWKKDTTNRQEGFKFKGTKPDEGIILLADVKKGKGT